MSGNKSLIRERQVFCGGNTARLPDKGEFMFVIEKIFQDSVGVERVQCRFWGGIQQTYSKALLEEMIQEGNYILMVPTNQT